MCISTKYDVMVLAPSLQTVLARSVSDNSNSTRSAIVARAVELNVYTSNVLLEYISKQWPCAASPSSADELHHNDGTAWIRVRGGVVWGGWMVLFSYWTIRWVCVHG